MPTSALPTCLMPAAEPLDASPVGAQPVRLWRRTAALWLAVFAVYWLTLFAATHIPNPQDFARRALDFDKVIHATSYAVLTTLALIAWRRTGGVTNLPTRLAIGAAAICYGVIDEVTQPLFYRVGDLADWIADATGVSLAVAFDAWRHRRD